MISIIYPYRDRDINRVEKSFESLRIQSALDFEVFFVDYGSKSFFSKQVYSLCSTYDFVTYRYFPTQFQPWNKSKALNVIIKNLTSEFCFVADVDLIFHPDFVKKAQLLQRPETAIYFQVGFLRPDQKEGENYFDYTNYRKSTSEATGLCMFPVKILKELRGFDEFYHFWGAEDTDMLVRLNNAGYKTTYYDKEVLMIHQWHPSYRSKETKNLTEDLQISGIVQLNHQRLKSTIKNNCTLVNFETWGEILSEDDRDRLEIYPVNCTIQTEKSEIDNLIYGELPTKKNEELKLVIETPSFQVHKKNWLKNLLGKKAPKYYSLKEVNDLVLLHLITFYRNKPYIFKVNTSQKRIVLCIKF